MLVFISFILPPFTFDSKKNYFGVITVEPFPLYSQVSDWPIESLGTAKRFQFCGENMTLNIRIYWKNYSNIKLPNKKMYLQKKKRLENPQICGNNNWESYKQNNYLPQDNIQQAENAIDKVKQLLYGDKIKIKT